MDREIHINISWLTLWRIFVFLMALIVLYLAKDAFLVLLISLVISLAIEPFVNFLENKKIPRVLAVFIVFLFSLLLIGLLIYFIIPLFFEELQSFFISLTEFFKEIINQLNSFKISSTIFNAFKDNLDNLLKDFVQKIGSLANNFLFQFFGNLFLLISVLLISFYLATEKDGIANFLKIIIPDNYEKGVLFVFNNFQKKIRKWVWAQVLLSLSIGFLTFIGLSLLGVPYVLAISVLAAVFEIVPVIGPIFVGLFAFLMAASISPGLGLYAVLFFIFVQQLESHVLAPLIIGKTVKIHPVLVIVSLIAGAQVAGFVGVILAVPLAIFIQELINYLSFKKARRSYLNFSGND